MTITLLLHGESVDRGLLRVSWALCESLVQAGVTVDFSGTPNEVVWVQIAQ